MKNKKKEEFYRRIRPVFGIEEKGKAAAYCMENWPEETAHVIRAAKEACCNTFLFDFPWDMERTYEPVTFEKEIDWSLIPFGDREFLWQFNRHRFLLCLGQAYHLTGEEQYAFHYVRLMRNWMERAEPGEAIDLGPWRTLEAG
ncbi:MAG TPA: heparinase, partial [Clostridium sp.]|nr:heparinase [Clostridium sp.]